MQTFFTNSFARELSLIVVVTSLERGRIGRRPEQSCSSERAGGERIDRLETDGDGAVSDPFTLKAEVGTSYTDLVWFQTPCVVRAISLGREDGGGAARRRVMGCEATSCQIQNDSDSNAAKRRYDTCPLRTPARRSG